MKKMIIMLFMFLMLIFPKSVMAYEEDEINIYVFWGNGCSHCEALIGYLDTLDYDNVNIKKYEVWHDFYGGRQMQRAMDLFGLENSGVPLAIIGDDYISGFSEGLTPKKIESLIEKYTNGFYNDTLGVEFGLSEAKEYPEGYEKSENKIFSLPILGDINVKDASLFIVTVVLGFVDGFNPCSMWVLLFLISMLIGMKDRKRMWILGLSFILTSAIIYYFFMAAWLNLMIVIGTPRIVQGLIGVFAVVMSIIYLKDYIKGRKEGIACKAVGSKKKNKIIDRIKKFTKEKSLFIALTGIVILAISVNTVELFCSLGLPVIFTEILTVSGVSKLSYYLHIALYDLFFMLDDIFIFVIAMLTFKITGISTKYSVLAKLIGGIVMFIIGILMIVDPGILM